jgi:long-subunit acyl-CoA synthetase (AMP-forming)
MSTWQPQDRPFGNPINRLTKRSIAHHFDNRIADRIDQQPRLVLADRQWRHQHHDVAQRSNPHATLNRRLANAIADLLVRCETLVSVALLNQFDADHRTTLANVADVTMIFQRGQSHRNLLGPLASVFQHRIVTEYVQRRERRSRRKRVAAKRVAMKKSVRETLKQKSK